MGNINSDQADSVQIPTFRSRNAPRLRTVATNTIPISGNGTNLHQSENAECEQTFVETVVEEPEEEPIYAIVEITPELERRMQEFEIADNLAHTFDFLDRDLSDVMDRMMIILSRFLFLLFMCYFMQYGPKLLTAWCLSPKKEKPFSLIDLIKKMLYL